ncbi:VOC family protein [Phyllobacterium sp. 0TCS1.6C]|uniref:bleomycin resistance protein n=1 Tax=unclassified Phyllobacterium TaxID=2638441 RepID=UPI002264206C|nr:MULTISPECIES: VOC family protein [unclassified Phyllobacterium]MCX8281510.1 VOC family protein [Phyllobacterium sp. 0TCS1.6C]MCX8292894.1 VOC family protein [Phyllobacterium sp. 0TCS1.6A]
MSNALVPEFAVSDWRKSKAFYCDVLGFTCLYERAEEGFCYLALGEAEIMIDQIGQGRTFDDGHLPESYPFGRGLNVQIRVDGINGMMEALRRHNFALYLAPEEKWYRVDEVEFGHRQFIVADPDGYLLRFYEELGT